LKGAEAPHPQYLVAPVDRTPLHPEQERRTMAQRTRGDAGPSHTGRVGDGELGEKQILRPDKDGFKNLYADLDKKWELSR